MSMTVKKLKTDPSTKIEEYININSDRKGVLKDELKQKNCNNGTLQTSLNRESKVIFYRS